MTAINSALAGWLNDVRERGLNITAAATGVSLGGEATPTDQRLLNRYRHALTVAASGSHAYWWETVLGRHPVHPDLPLPGTYEDPACACCGSPAPHLDPDLLPWCDAHHTPEVA